MTRTVVVGALLLAFAAGVWVGVRARPRTGDAPPVAARPAPATEAYYGKPVRSDNVLFVLDLGAGPQLFAPVPHDSRPPR